MGKTKNNYQSDSYDRIWKTVYAVLILATLICADALNIMGGIGFMMNGYSDVAVPLFISAGALSLSVLFLPKGRIVIPMIFNIIGSACYIYSISYLSSIPHEKIPKQSMEVLINRIYPAVIVTVLILVMCIINIYHPVREEKREEAKKKKWDAEKRPLTKDEKII